jgi:protein disulfide-isomerase A1
LCLQVDSVVIAKMDGTENEHPDVEVKGFPTIIFFPAGKDAKPITFDGGDRSLKVRF